MIKQLCFKWCPEGNTLAADKLVFKLQENQSRSVVSDYLQPHGL